MTVTTEEFGWGQVRGTVSMWEQTKSGAQLGFPKGACSYASSTPALTLGGGGFGSSAHAPIADGVVESFTESETRMRALLHAGFVTDLGTRRNGWGKWTDSMRGRKSMRRVSFKRPKASYFALAGCTGARSTDSPAK
ncbi:MAG: hypothetical protein H0U64_12375 [Gemmatimonadaceae bacterium]|nr:hypothetical protein [Gemmatimonadaceae bacterium]